MIPSVIKAEGVVSWEYLILILTPADGVREMLATWWVPSGR